MTISEELNKLINSKEAIRQSIIAKGTDVGTDVPFSDYASKIDEIQTGDGSTYVNPDFYEIVTKGGTDYRNLFYYCKLESLDLSNWDVSNVTDITYMCYGSDLITLNMANWNLNSLTKIYNPFYSCKKLKTLNVTGWNISNVTEICNLLTNCTALEEFDLSSWDTSHVTDMCGSSPMITGCSSLKTIKGNIDCSSNEDGLYYISSYYVFKGCTALEEVYLTNIYKNSTIRNDNKWSIDLKDTIIKDECLISIINELPDLINDKGLTATDKIVLTLPLTNTLTAEQVQPAIDKGWTVANITSNIANGASTYGLRRNKVYKLIETENGVYQSQDGILYDLLEANNALSLEGLNIGWEEYRNLDAAIEGFNLIYVGNEEEE